jgi:hypothetical protein
MSRHVMSMGLHQVYLMSDGIEYRLCGAVSAARGSLVSALHCAQPTLQQAPASLLPSAFLFPTRHSLFFLLSRSL